MLTQIWQSLKNFLQKLFNPRSDGATSPSAVGGKKPPKPYKPLSEADYDYLFSQLLEGIAYGGWQPGRIQRFFDTLEERGKKEGWLNWLEGYGSRVLAVPNRDRELGRRLVKLGEQTQSLPANSSARKIGAIAARIGNSLLAPAPTQIWQYDGPDTALEPSPAEAEVTPSPVADVAPVPAETAAPDLATIPLEELLAQLEQNPALAQQVARQLGLEIADPQAAIQEIVRQLQPDPHPTSMSAENAEDPEAWFNRGVQQYELEDFAEAIACWNRAIDLQPNYYQAWSNRGLALKNLGRWDEVLSSYDRALELEPTYDKAWYNRGIALSELGRREEAIASFDRVLALNPDDYKTWYSRGNTLQSAQQYAEAIASYDRALELKADLPEIWYERGNALKYSEQYAEAISSYDRALELKADLPEIWCGRGDVLAAAGSHEEAIASYDRALQLKPDAWEVWLGRSRATKVSAHADLLLSSLSSIAQSNPELNQRGEAGQIASLTAGLKNLYPNTHPEGWGRLHWQLGQVYYRQGCDRDRPLELWREAIGHYNEALTTLTETAFPEVHLEVLQDLIQVQWGLEETVQATKLRQRGIALRQRLLDSPQRSEAEKQQLARKFMRLDRLGVDLAVQSGELIEALEQAEQVKEADLGWHSAAEPICWSALHPLLNPTTAIVCWHLSPVALTTFILRPDAAEPIVLGQPANAVVNVVLTPSLRSKIKSAQGDREELSRLLLGLLDLDRESQNNLDDPAPPDECPEALHHRQSWQDWANHWQQLWHQPQAWRQNLPELLTQLSTLLDLPAILREIERESSQRPQTKIENLILIPHQELHCFPLQALFALFSAGEDKGSETRPNLTLSSFPSLRLCWESLSVLAVAQETGRSRSPNQPRSLLNLEVGNSLLPEQAPDSQPDPHLEWTALSQYYQASQRLLDPSQTDAIASLLHPPHLLYYRGSTDAEGAALVLGGSDRLTAAEIYTLPLSNVQLIVLLAAPPLEWERWHHACLSQGAAHVLTTHWPVESIASSLFIVEFYRRIASGAEPPTALKQTQQWLQAATYRQLVQWYLDRDRELTQEDGPPLEIFREKANAIQASPEKIESTHPPYAHPYYWAGFTIVGRLSIE